jgi:hypothetical protein
MANRVQLHAEFRNGFSGDLFVSAKAKFKPPEKRSFSWRPDGGEGQDSYDMGDNMSLKRGPGAGRSVKPKRR